MKLVAMSPSAIPRKGAITLAGTVTNSSDGGLGRRQHRALRLATADHHPERAGPGLRHRRERRRRSTPHHDRHQRRRRRPAPRPLGAVPAARPRQRARHHRRPGRLLDRRARPRDQRRRPRPGGGRPGPDVHPAREPRRGPVRASVPVSVVLPLRQRVRRAADGALNRPGPLGPADRCPADGSRGWSTSAPPRARRRSPGWSIRPCSTRSTTSAAATRRSPSPRRTAPRRREQGRRGRHKDGTRDQKGDSEPSQGASPSAAPSPEPGTPTQAERNDASSCAQHLPGHREDAAAHPAHPGVRRPGRRLPDPSPTHPGQAGGRAGGPPDEGVGPVRHPDRGPSRRVLRPGTSCPRSPGTPSCCSATAGNLTEPPLSRLPRVRTWS